MTRGNMKQPHRIAADVTPEHTLLREREIEIG
jgi:hypothetical protein